MYLEVAPYLEAPYLDMGCHPNCEGAEALSFDYLIPTLQILIFVLSPCSFGEIVANGAKL